MILELSCLRFESRLGLNQSNAPQGGRTLLCSLRFCSSNARFSLIDKVISVPDERLGEEVCAWIK